MARTATRRTAAATATVEEEERADQALVRHLSDGRYHSADELAQRLRTEGFRQQFSYVLAKARKAGNVAVCGDEHATYTSTPTAHEAYRDLRKRRRMATALLRNAMPTAGYLSSSHRTLLRELPANVQRQIRAETSCMRRLHDQVKAAVRRAGVMD